MTIPQLALIGTPIKQSMSDVYHRAFFRQMNIVANYEKIELNSDQLGSFISSAKSSHLGLSVTMPLKEAIIPYLDVVDHTAMHIGAVNTVKFFNHQAYGWNTDGKGALRAIYAKYGENLRDKQAVIVGAGGVAKAIAWELTLAGMKLTIVNRDIEKALHLSKRIEANVAPIQELEKIIQTQCDLLIQATSVGMTDENWILSPDKIPSSVAVFETISAAQNQWLSTLANQGSLTISGKQMWRHQAIEQYKLWFDDINKISDNDLFQVLFDILLMQAIIGSILISMNLFIPTMNQFYWIFQTLAAQLILMMYLMVFASVIKLRYSQPDVKRLYHVPGGKFGVWVIAGTGACFCTVAFFVGFIPPTEYQFMGESTFAVILLTGIFLFCVPPFLWQWMKNRVK